MRIDFKLDAGGNLLMGSFFAPIVRLTIDAQNGDEHSAFAFYELGPGLFDASIPAPAPHYGRVALVAGKRSA